jgi:predicted lipase
MSLNHIYAWILSILKDGIVTRSDPHFQWYVHQQDCGYTLRCVSSGLLLNYEGDELRDGLKVIANEEERVWEIYFDEEHGGFR